MNHYHHVHKFPQMSEDFENFWFQIREIHLGGNCMNITAKIDEFHLNTPPKRKHRQQIPQTFDKPVAKFFRFERCKCLNPNRKKERRKGM